MTDQSRTSSSRAPRLPRLWACIVQTVDPLVAAAWAAVVLGVAIRLGARPDVPLWLDETWTGAIIAQDSLGEVLRQSLLDTTAPLYFALMHGWSLLFGLSNSALRFPSLIFGALAALVALIPVNGIPRSVRYLWCALIALWIPGLWYSDEARCYAMLLCLAIAGTVAYAHLLAAPDLRRAALWAGIGSLSILTHYHALVLFTCQGLAYLALHRGRAERTWPAALIFAPALGWMLMHLPYLWAFADPQVAWQDRLSLLELAGVFQFILGDRSVAIGLIGIALVLLVIRPSCDGDAKGAEMPPPSSIPWVVIATAGLGAAIVLAAAVLSTSFTGRYLIPFMPGLMLGVAMAIVRLGQRWAAIPLAVVGVFAVSAVVWSIEGRQQALKLYNFQTASDALMAADVRNLIFLFDNPIAQVCDRGQLAAIGGFFFRRAGRPVSVQPVTLRPGDDPNTRVLAAANGRPQTGILWLYDLGVRGPAARTYPPRIAQLDPAWRCRQFGAGPFGVVACDNTRPQP